VILKNLFFAFCLFSATLFGQKVADCKYRFDTYLNFHGSLSSLVKFENNAITLLNSVGKKTLIIYAEEIPALAQFFENSTLKMQQDLIQKKGLTRYTSKQLDSLLGLGFVPKIPITAQVQKKLLGYKIALDPGHFGTNLQDAHVEQKYLYFPAKTGEKIDTVKLFESTLTFNTASILKAMLEEQGAEVFVTRQQANFTSFDCTYSDWLVLHKKRVLDSMRAKGSMPPQKYLTLSKANNYDFFWSFFRDFDLANRAMKINNFDPDVTLIIHYNVDEKNVPWTKCTPKNFTMAFIGGAFTADNLSKHDGKAHFMRLLLTDQLNRSQSLAQETVASFNKQLDIKIATQSDATYLKSSCLKTASPGVFCRNLALCRKINSPLVYGESLYQDNEKESFFLMQSDKDLYGIKTNERLQKVAQSYYDGLLAFLKSDSVIR